MDAILALIATVLLIHALEGGFWVRRTAFVFVQRRKSWARLPTHSPIGNTHSVFVFGSPFPPLPALTVVDPWPILCTKEAIYNVPICTLEVDELRLPSFSRVGAEEAARARAEGKTVYVGRSRFVDLSSVVLADRVAAAMREWAGLDPEARVDFDEHRRQRHDADWIRDRFAQYLSCTKYSRPLANVVPGLLVASLAGVLIVQSVYMRWPIILAVNLAALFAIWLGFFRGHQRLHPEHRLNRWYQMMLFVFAPLSAGRAHAWLARDLFAGAEPIDVARVLQNEEDLLETAGRIWRDAGHPIALAAYASVPPEALERERTRVRAHVRKGLAAAGLEPRALERAPEREPPSFEAYCPRCRAVFAEAVGDCSDCPGVSRRRFDAKAE